MSTAIADQCLTQDERDALLALISARGEEQTARGLSVSRLAMVRGLAGLNLSRTVVYVLRGKIAELTRETPCVP